MTPRGVKVAHIAFLVFSALLAFLVLRAMDEEAILGAPARILVEDFGDSAASSTRVVEEVESFADAHDVNVGLEMEDLRNPGDRRHLYLAVGDREAPSASWLEEGYPNFSREFHTEVHPLRKMSGLDPRGYYLIFGAPQAADELLTEFERLGFKGQVAPEPSLLETISFFGQGGVRWAFLVVAVAAAMVVGASVVLNAKAYGVLRLQGKSFIRILGRDLGELAAFWGRAAAAMAAGVLLLLSLYNGLDRLGRFALIAGALLAVLTLVALAAHVVALAMTYRTRVLEAIKGEVSGTLPMAGAYAIRIPAALLTVAIIASAVTAWQGVEAKQASREAYAKIGDASTVSLTADPADRRVEQELDATVGAWIRESECQGEVILAYRSDMMDFIPPDQQAPDRDVLLVNNEYLAQQSILDASGHRLRGSQEPGIRAQILIPESLSGSANRFVSPLIESLKSEAHLAGNRLDASQVETLQTQSGQSVFTYGSGMYTGRPAEALVRDPIIVVIPSSSGILDDGQYVAYATQSGVIFKDPADVRAAMSTGVGKFLIGMQPVAQRAADEYQDLIGELRLALFNTAAALAVVLLTAAGVGQIYSRKNAQALFVKYISGWTFAGAHRNLLVVEGALVLALIGWSAWDTRNKISALRELEAQGLGALPGTDLPLGGWEPAVMLGIGALGLAVILAVSAISYHRLVRNRAVEE